jgi:hypothetical protein
MRDFAQATEYDAHVYAEFRDLVLFRFCKEIPQVFISWNFIQCINA